MGLNLSTDDVDDGDKPQRSKQTDNLTLHYRKVIAVKWIYPQSINLQAFDMFVFFALDTETRKARMTECGKLKNSIFILPFNPFFHFVCLIQTLVIPSLCCFGLNDMIFCAAWRQNKFTSISNLMPRKMLNATVNKHMFFSQ